MIEIYKTVDGRYRGVKDDRMTGAWTTKLTLLHEIIESAQTTQDCFHWSIDVLNCDFIKAYPTMLDVMKDIPNPEKYL